MDHQPLDVTFDDWEAHAKWWDNESHDAATRMAADPAQLQAARRAFGIIGSATVGAALVEVLQTREAAGVELGDEARAHAARIRASLAIYTDAESENTSHLSGGGAGPASPGAASTEAPPNLAQLT